MPIIMNQRDYDRLKRQIQDEYEHKLAALEIIWQMAKPANAPQPPSRKWKSQLQKTLQASDATGQEATPSEISSGNSAPVQVEATKPNGRLRKGELQKAILAVLPELPAQFRPSQVMKKIEARFPEMAGKIQKASLSSALKRMAEFHPDFNLDRPGSGKRPSRYAKMGKIEPMKNAS